MSCLHGITYSLGIMEWCVEKVGMWEQDRLNVQDDVFKQMASSKQGQNGGRDIRTPVCVLINLHRELHFTLLGLRQQVG